MNRDQGRQEPLPAGRHGRVRGARSPGALDPEVPDEKAISARVEFVLPEDAAGELLEIARELSGAVDTAFNVCVALRANGGGSSPFASVLGPHVFSLPDRKVDSGLAAGIPPRETQAVSHTSQRRGLDPEDPGRELIVLALVRSEYRDAGGAGVALLELARRHRSGGAGTARRGGRRPRGRGGSS